MSARELHRRIATAVTDREERARHLALAAAELAELALKLTPEHDTDRARTRRRVAAHHHFLAGDVGRSRAILEQLVGELPAGTERARALHHLAERALPLEQQAGYLRAYERVEASITVGELDQAAARLDELDETARLGIAYARAGRPVPRPSRSRAARFPRRVPCVRRGTQRPRATPRPAGARTDAARPRTDPASRRSPA